jgi:hypothetical protein
VTCSRPQSVTHSARLSAPVLNWQVLRITPDPLPVAAASAAAISPPMPPLMDTIDPNFHPPRPPPAPAPPGWPPPPPPPRRDDPPLGLLMFLHGYTGDASWATSQFWLHQLVDELNLMVIAPNGRTDGLGYSYWLGTDHFTGFFTARMNTTTGDEQHIPPERGSWQRMAADYVRSSPPPAACVVSLGDGHTVHSARA